MRISTKGRGIIRAHQGAVAFLLSNAKNMNYYSNYETDRLIIGTNQNIPLQGLLAVMCINNT